VTAIPAHDTAELFLAFQAERPRGEPRASRSSIEQQALAIGSLLRFLGGNGASMDEIQPQAVAAWRDELERRLGPATVNRYLARLSAWFRWAQDRQICTLNPVRPVRRLRVPQKRPRLPIGKPEGFWATVQGLEPPLSRLAFVLLATTGMRQGEAKALTWDGVDDGWLDVPGADGGTKRHDRRIPLCGQAAGALGELRAINPAGYCIGQAGGEKPLTSHLNHWWKPTGVRPHDLRRWYRTALEGLGGQHGIIDDLLGHSTSRVRAAYTPGMNEEAATELVKRFEDWLGSAP